MSARFNALRAIQAAEVHVVNPLSKCGSASYCLRDARALYEQGRFEYAYERALKSLAYSVGINSPVYLVILRLKTCWL